jgi:hypothetical protein
MMAENGERERARGCLLPASPSPSETTMRALPRISPAVALALSGALLAPPSLHAAASPATSACGAADYHRLDFWIGDWDTFETETPAGASVARAHVDAIAGGCAIHELYEQNDGLIGDSILSFDPVRKQWQQTWVTNRGSIMVIHGDFRDGKLVLEGDVHLADGRTVRQRITWEAQDGGVRESAVLSKDGGTTWTPSFDVVFRKRH